MTLSRRLLTINDRKFNSVNPGQRDDDYIWDNETLPDWLEESGLDEYDLETTLAADRPANGQRVVGSKPLTRSPFGSCCDPLRLRPTLTGDWHGKRTCLQQNGITYRGRVTQFFFGVAGGNQDPVPARLAAFGFEGGDQFEYTGNSRHDFLFDLETLGGPKAGRFVFTLENLWGQYGNVSFETGTASPPIFNAFMPVDPDANGVPRVTNMLYIQPLSERLIVSVGKIRLAGAADRNIFAGGDGSDQFLNQTFVANPLYLNQLPLSTFTIGAVMPREWGNLSISVFDPQERSTDFFDLGDLFSEGVILFGQIKYNTNFFGRRGEHHLGGFYKHVDQFDLSLNPIPPSYPYPPAPPGVATLEDTYTLFYGFDQYLVQFGPEDKKGDTPGWGLFGRAGIADGGTGNPNFSSWHVSCGIGGDSPFRGRRNTRDRFGIAYAFTATSDQWGAIPVSLFGPRDSQIIESYYRYHVTPAISITPDLQWIRGALGGLTGGDDVFVFGMRMNIRL